MTNTVGINHLNEEMGKRGSNNAIDVKRQLQNGVQPHCYIPAIKKNKSQMTVFMMKFLHLCWWLKSHLCETEPITEPLQGHLHRGQTTSGQLNN